jgi:hypothetical protein
MIYKSSFLKKELRNAYLADGISRKKILGFGVFLGLLTFAIYFVLQTLTRSVLIDAVPEFMFTSYFSTLYLYTIVSYIFFVFYFIIYYEYLTFAEIRKNRWYILAKIGYKPVSMIHEKIFMKLVTVLLTYTLGFLVTIFLTYFLKFPFIWQYMLSLYMVGAINLVVLVIVTLVSSIFIKNPINARYTVVAIAISKFVFMIMSNYYNLVSDRVLMQNITNLFDFSRSPFLIITGILVSVSFITCVIVGNNIAKYYNRSVYKEKVHLEGHENENVSIVILDGADNYSMKKRVRSEYKAKAPNRLMNIVVSSSLVVVITVMMAFNLLTLAVTFVSPEKEIAIFGKIPYVFQSETMEPVIMYNDLAFFNKIEYSFPIIESDIVLYKNNGVVGVSRVQSIETTAVGKRFVVDVEKYTDVRQAGTFREIIKREDIYGIYAGRSRWLGAIILFANNVFGRMLLLLIPSFLIFFYKPINKFFRQINNGGLKE